MKILFLDVDGVLNSDAWFKQYETVGGLVVLSRVEDRIDPAAVTRLNRITDATDAYIILSTNWIYDNNVGEAQTKTTIRKMGVRAPFWGNGITVRKFSLKTREGEIGLTLRKIQEVTGSPPDGIVILEDEHPLYGFEPWTVRTEWETGLLEEHVEQAIEILSKPWRGRDSQ